MDIEIQHEESESKGAYFVELEGNKVGEMI